MSYVNKIKKISLCACVLISTSAVAETYEYKDLPQDQLDRAYNQAEWSPNFKEIIAGYHTASVEVQKTYHPQTFAYGPGDKEKLDIYSPKAAINLPIVLFVHGGAWKSGEKEDAAGPVKTFVDNGVIFVPIGFDVIPQTDLPGMVDQVRRSVSWIHNNARKFGGNPDKIYISGHSSGAHLAAVMLTTDWTRLGEPSDVLKGGILISGMGDLQPPMKSSRGSYLKLNDEQIKRYSPILNLKAAQAPVIVVWGGNESPEFIRQSKQLATAFKARGLLFWDYEFPKTDHFTMVNLLNSPTSALSKQTLELIKSK